MKKNIFILIFLSTVLSVEAQRHSGVLAHIFIPDMYIGANIGPNAFLSDGFSEYGFKDCYGLSETMFFGFNLTEIVGVRMVAAFSELNWPGIESRKIAGINFHTTALNVEGTYNLSTTFDNFNLNRPFDFSLFAGVGFISRERSTFKSEYISFFIKGGIQIDYRLNYKLDLSVQTNFNMLDERYNDQKFGRPFDLIPELKVGLTYHMRTNSRRFRN